MTKRLILLIVSSFALSYCQTPVLAPKKIVPTAKKVAPAPAPAPVQEAKLKPPTNELTVDQVAQLVQAGLSEDLVISKIKKNNKAFDLSTEQLLQLKKAGASDNIIRVLMDPTVQPVVAPPLTPAITAPPAMEQRAVQIIPRTCEAGFYLLGDNEKLTKIEPNTFATSRSSGTIGRALTVGIRKAKTKAVLRGPAAVARLKKGQQFSYCTVDGLAPIEYYLLRLNVVKGEREVTTATAGLSQTTGFDNKLAMSFTTKQVGDGKYELNASLEPGEYCFYPKRALRQTGALGEGVAAGGKVFDFGVE